MRALLYDAGAMLAAERGDPEFIALHDEATSLGLRPIVPVVALARVWRGGPQHRLSRLLKGCTVLPDDEKVGRAAGALCAAAGTSDVVDAIVVVAAASLAALVVTSDPRDLRRLAEAAGVPLTVHIV